MYEQEIINAVYQNNLHDLIACLDKGVNVNTRDTHGNLLIELVVYFQCREIFEHLVNNKVDLKICNIKKLINKERELSRNNPLLRELIKLRARALKHIEAQLDEDIAIIGNKLITTLLYESSRHGWDGEIPIELRIQIEYLAPWFIGKNKKDYIEYIQAQETENNTFYGSYLSDDSDSDEEREFSKKDERIRNFHVQNATSLREKAQVKKIFYQKDSKQAKKGDLKKVTDASRTFNLEKRTTIHYGNHIDANKIQCDLDHLNNLLKSGSSISEALSFLLSTDPTFTIFFVAQYRGITHLTTCWNQPSRKAHRKDQAEINKPQYSASVMVAAGVDIFRSYTTAEHRESVHPAASKLLKAEAELLREILLTLREPRPYSYEGYTYANLAYLLQAIYTQDYDGFHKLIKTDPLLSCLLLNDYNPFLSTGDTPYHAEKYAYGIKPYKGHEDERLRPRWRWDGKAERPYSGVVYASLHPLSDFTQDGPLHLISLNRAAEIKLKKELEIIAERESCFPAFLSEGRVFLKHVAKYPSFRGPYKQIYLYKYGLDENFYYKLQHKLQSARPHTSEMKAFKKLLGEWLCSYYEVSLIDRARREAEQRGGVLIYRGINGAFSLKPPIDSVNRNHNQITEEVKTPVKNKQQRRTSLSPCTSPEIIQIDNESSAEEVIDSLANLVIEDTANYKASTALSLLINAVREKRHLALAHYLKIPIFLQEINESFNTTDITVLLPRVGLLHLAILENNPEAVRLLLQIPRINVNLLPDETEENPYYDFSFSRNLTPLKLAIDKDQIEIVSLLCKHPKIRLNLSAKYIQDTFLLDKIDFGLRNYIQNCSTPKKPTNVADDVFDYLCTLKKKNINLLTHTESSQYIPRQAYFGENDRGCTREIAYALFSWFDTDSLKKSSKVCKAWKKLASDITSDQQFKFFSKEGKDEIVELEKSLNNKLKI